MVEIQSGVATNSVNMLSLVKRGLIEERNVITVLAKKEEMFARDNG